ncbi:MAG TPA: ammonia-forming cytochrome c nitrite reductase [Bacteroidales bacterium]|nr:ammonia-forming cytochrome c nitrite reductase [Bacteroidales bacterium]
MKFSLSKKIAEKPLLGWLLFLGTVIVVFVLGLFASTIIQRRTEATVINAPLYQLDKFEPRNEMWGKAYPREYETYKQMDDTSFRSKYNGNAMRDALDEDPRLVILFAGYAFSKDYNQPRGHIYAVTDVHNTLRTGTPKDETEGPQPSSCWTCKSPDSFRMMYAMGAGDFFKKPWAAHLSEIINPIGCANCHNPDDQSLRIAQIPLIEAFERQGRDAVNTPVNDRRTLVCAQCHVEYYFKGDGKYVTFPWDKGTTVEEIEKYYDEIGFTDWVHPLSKTPIIKAQHPDYELFQSSIHYKNKVSCADCHMPYITMGSQKLTDHKVQSPLNNMEASCMVCHRDSKEELTEHVYERQDKVYEQKIILEDLLVKAHIETAFAIEKGATPEQLKPIHTYIRAAQWRWDFVAASHGGSFHAPLECMRIISSGIEKASLARLEVARLLASLGYNQDVPMPDISTKEKAQTYIGLDPVKMKADKEEWLKNKLPGWLKKAEERQAKMPEPKRIG